MVAEDDALDLREGVLGVTLNADSVGHVIGPLEPDVLPTPRGYRHGLQVRCRCGWAVKGPTSTAVAIDRQAIDHLGDPDGTPHVMGFRPIVDLWLTLPSSGRSEL